MKKAILVASFGTSYEDTCVKNIDAVEKTVRDNFSDYTIYSAFTSEMIRKKLAKTGKIIENVPTALEKMKTDGISEVVILPTHLIYGIEYEKVCTQANNFKHDFKAIRVAKPLLSDVDIINRVLQIITEHNTIEDDEAIVLMGHGSEHYANMVYPAMNYVAQDFGFNNVFTCTVEGYPEIDSIIKMLKNKNYKKVLLTPLMLVAGDHANNDMASNDDDSLKSVLEHSGFIVRCIVKGLGEYKEIREIYCENIAEQIV